MIAYADDVFVLFGGQSRADLEYKGNRALNMIYERGITNKLCFNANKSKAIVFNKPRQRKLYARVPTLRMNGKSLKVVKELKYLGILLDHRLSWNNHIRYITKHTGHIMHAFAKVARSSWGLSGLAMGMIYDSIFLPVLTYGCGIWGSAAVKVHQKRKLISAQRRALLMITKAYRTTANASLQVLARKPPIDKYINYLQKIWKVKCGNHLTSMSNSFTEESWEKNIPYKDTFSPYTNIRFIEASSTSCAIKIFTDGSKCDCHVGASFVAFRNNIEIYYNVFKLGPLCSIFQAELYAILQAIEWCERALNNAKIAIITDSLSSLSTIRRKSVHPLVFSIQRLLIESDNEYYFNWTRSHCNDYGNDRADQLAKMAAGRREFYKTVKINMALEVHMVVSIVFLTVGSVMVFVGLVLYCLIKPELYDGLVMAEVPSPIFPTAPSSSDSELMCYSPTWKEYAKRVRVFLGLFKFVWYAF
ncbi:uncharacterized protein LOC111633201 [Centruroides sculpturatus]|uniref:uncharacterized protein LOC111633201 n=1 Tax=Centruroides sculpturatus TaxID=218467 RepID=UPI000C6D0E5E|nr:uncharacterized protein LOC111633201 [Centruroides sculpturatus]